MVHARRDNVRLLARVRRMQGQIEALARLLREQRECNDVLQQIAAVLSADPENVRAVRVDGRRLVRFASIDKEAARPFRNHLALAFLTFESLGRLSLKRRGMSISTTLCANNGTDRLTCDNG